MTLTLDPATEQRLQRQLDHGTFRSSDDLLAHALDLVETQNVMDDWLLRYRAAIQRDLEESFAEEARGESYSPEEARAILAERRAARS
jgi:Arc/MetJ-type ribon-helix-helix transcriptional regulator